MLTEGAIQDILFKPVEQHPQKPVFQILEIKKIQTKGHEGAGNDRYRLVLSDGVNLFTSVMLVTQLNDLVTSKEIEVKSVVQLDKYICNVIKETRKVLIVLEVSVIKPASEVVGKIGDPKSVHADSTQQQQLQQNGSGAQHNTTGKRRCSREVEQQDNLQRQLSEMEQHLSNCQGQLQEKELSEASLHEQLREKEQQEDNLQMQLRDVEERLTNQFEGQIREKEEERASIQQRVTTIERQLRVKEQELSELELSLSTAQQTISEQQRRQEKCDWVIARNEIQMTDKCLGRGGWGSVYEGMYCGCTIAVKQIHELILSPHNRRLFEREMNIASRCRHPCLLQFIGATNDEGSPLFVTELMETSLRALLEQQQLSDAEISVISLDVARALNYLHQKKPSPIIHRDVSSANVLLWRQGDQWRGKVSDYGTARFMQQTMTVAPGAMIYSAPEAITTNQTDKIDVYSFGVLLCEMCIRELPDPEKREEQVALIKERVFRGLVRQCLQTDPERRSNMLDIIDSLKQFNVEGERKARNPEENGSNLS